MHPIDISINTDLEQRVVVTPPNIESWRASPCRGVWRHHLERSGGESSRASSIVRYEAGASFDRHTHYGGEEIFVLEGCFSDESGDYPAGTYLRRPPGSSHQPFSDKGCTIFVKVWQFSPGDTRAVSVNTRSSEWYPGMVPGLRVMPLHEFDGVSSALVKWAPHTRFNPHTHPGGEEILVIDGLFCDEYGAYPAGSWLRSPRWSKHTPYTGQEGALIYVKVGHIGATMLQPEAIAL